MSARKPIYYSPADLGVANAAIPAAGANITFNPVDLSGKTEVTIRINQIDGGGAGGVTTAFQLFVVMLATALSGGVPVTTTIGQTNLTQAGSYGLIIPAGSAESSFAEFNFAPGIGWGQNVTWIPAFTIVSRQLLGTCIPLGYAQFRMAITINALGNGHVDAHMFVR